MNIVTNNCNLLVKKLLQKFYTPRLFLQDRSLWYVELPVNVEELSKAIKKPVEVIVSFFWNKGQEITKNQNLSQAHLTQYCRSLGLVLKQTSLEFNTVLKEYIETTIAQTVTKWTGRPPVISIMGHIDHGKTTLVDTICHSNIQQKESGGITQKISVFSIDFQNKKIILLDTPGHNDFIRLRHRGVSLTDIVILVIDAKEKVMSQTEEIIDYLLQYSLPALVLVGDKIISGDNEEVPVSVGNNMPLCRIPPNTLIHNLELKPKKGGQLLRSAGVFGEVIGKEEEGKYVKVKLKSKEIRRVLGVCRATIGKVGNSEANLVRLGKAGRNIWRGIRPTVRGSAMNPCDHPHGGGEGKCGIGHKSPLDPWGNKTLGKKTRKKNRLSNKYIIKSRSQSKK